MFEEKYCKQENRLLAICMTMKIVAGVFVYTMHTKMELKHLPRIMCPLQTIKLAR